MSSTDQGDILEEEDAFIRAATSHVHVGQLKDRLYEMEQYLHVSETSHRVLSKALSPGSETCIFDPTKNVIEYLPTPVIHDREQPPPSDEEKTSESTTSVSAAAAAGNNTDTTASASSLRKSKLAGSLALKSFEDNNDAAISLDPEFDSVFRPDDMKMLALVSHNSMKHSMKQFVIVSYYYFHLFIASWTYRVVEMEMESTHSIQK